MADSFNDNSEVEALSSEKERAEVLEEIERLVSTRRLDSHLSNAAFKKVKRGMWFPFAVNLLSLGLLAGGLLGARWYFSQKEEEIRTQTQQEFSAEGRLVARLLEESQKRIQEQQEQIDRIQGDLSRLAAEKDELAGSLETRIREREASLREQLAAELEVERRRLAGQGVSQEEITRRLQELEARRNQELNASLAQAREEAQREIAAREARLAELQSQLSTARTAQEEARRAAEEQSRGQITNLETQLTEQAAYLERLADEREADRNLLRQVEAGFLQVRAALPSGAAPSLAALDALDSLLAGAAASASETLARRIQVFQSAAAAVRSALGNAVITEVVQTATADPSLDELKDLVNQARENPADQARLWSEAVGKIEEVSEAVEGLRALDVRNRTAAEARLEQSRLTAVRRAVADFSELGPEAGWERLLSAVAPEGSGAAQAELRDGISRALDASLAAVRTPSPVNTAELEGQIQALNEANATLTERAQTAEAKIVELESTASDLARQLEEFRNMEPETAIQEAALARTAQLEEQIGLLQTELENLRQNETRSDSDLREKEEEILRLRSENTSLLEQVAQLGRDLEAVRASVPENSAPSSADSDEVLELRQFKTRTEELSRVWKSAASTALAALRDAGTVTRIQVARDLLAEAMEQQNGASLFPDFRLLVESLTEAQQRVGLKPEDVAGARTQAFIDVLKLTSYLEGNSGRGDVLNSEVTNLAAADENYRRIVESVQRLALRGAQETPVSTEEWQLLGAVISAVGTRVNAEILRSPESALPGLSVEIRRATDQTQILARGTLETVTGRRATIAVSSQTEGARLPIGGDVVYVRVR